MENCQLFWWRACTFVIGYGGEFGLCRLCTLTYQLNLIRDACLDAMGFKRVLHAHIESKIQQIDPPACALLNGGISAAKVRQHRPR